MAKKKKKSTARREGIPLPKQRETEEKRKKEKEAPPVHPSQNAVRETLESLAIAFMLAFFIRTFVVEPFVIPTGSMSPSLQGVHKDLRCPQCGERYRVNASKQAQMRYERAADECLGGMCPNCRYTTVYDPRVANSISFSPQEKYRFDQSPDEVLSVPNYSGDRIVVNKFLYCFSDPERWDVVVFKYPGLATDNYIKRCVGLPGETLRLYGGDLFVKAAGEEEFEIARKPPGTLLAMSQDVHDTNHDPAKLYKAGWPLRWKVQGAESAWKSEENIEGQTVSQQYVAQGKGDTTSWLRYVHTPPTNEVWPAIENTRAIPPAEPSLIGDFNSYNTRIEAEDVLIRARRSGAFEDNPFVVDEYAQGIHWVGDLIVDIDVEVKSTNGQLLLELVEAGHRFRCLGDVSTGEMQLEILPQGASAPVESFTPKAATALRGKGTHTVKFANVDDALYVWIDNKLVEFDKPTTYDWDELFGTRDGIEPCTSHEDPGDLAPIGIGTRGASVAVSRLKVSRDIYYIATRGQTSVNGSGGSRSKVIVTDYPMAPPRDILSNPQSWDSIGRRTEVQFPLGEDQFFVMGDNSPQSSDARLWNPRLPPGRILPKPGGNYLERKHLIGRAISVVWPHTWNYVIPGFSDMRRIK